MDKWKEYGTYGKWKTTNEDELRSSFDACKYERENMMEPPSFDEYCMGAWQRL